MTQGLVVGRFQIVGNQHVDMLEQIVDYHRCVQPLSLLNIGIGIANRVDGRNPFSGTECLEMIRPVADEYAGIIGVPTRYRLIPDINDSHHYAAHVAEHFAFADEPVVVFGENEYLLGCFRNKPQYSVVKVKERLGQHSTDLRKLYGAGADISGRIPESVQAFLERDGTRKRVAFLLSYDQSREAEIACPS